MDSSLSSTPFLAHHCHLHIALTVFFMMECSQARPLNYWGDKGLLICPPPLITKGSRYLPKVRFCFLPPLTQRRILSSKTRVDFKNSPVPSQTLGTYNWNSLKTVLSLGCCFINKQVSEYGFRFSLILDRGIPWTIFLKALLKQHLRRIKQGPRSPYTQAQHTHSPLNEHVCTISSSISSILGKDPNTCPEWS